MNLKEYLIKISTSLDTEEGYYHIMIDEYSFKLHKDCWIDFHEDFMILYDKETKVNLLVRYDSISAIQHVPEDKIKEMKSRHGALAQLLKEALEDDD